MDLTPSAEQEAIQRSIRSFLESELPIARVRALAEGGPQEIEAAWRRAGELGFFGLAAPAAQGGTGYSLVEEMILFEELGRALAPGPWLGTVLAAHALAAARDDRAAERRAALHAGRSRVALVDVEAAPIAFAAARANEPGVPGDRRDADDPAAPGDPGAPGAPGDPRDAIRPTGAGDATVADLTLRAPAVADAAGADLLLVLHGDAVLIVEPDAAGVELAPGHVFDASRPVAAVSLTAVRAERLPGSARALRRIGVALSCAEAVGASERLVELSVDYARMREQFGRPIGSFQAVKHRCADMAVRAEAARAATVYATLSLRDGTDDCDFQLSVAKVLATDAFVLNAADNVQNHGGFGFTWECDAHLYVKRSRGFEACLGSQRSHLDAIAAHLRGA